jgi:hypothetical protein
LKKINYKKNQPKKLKMVVLEIRPSNAKAFSWTYSKTIDDKTRICDILSEYLGTYCSKLHKNKKYLKGSHFYGISCGEWQIDSQIILQNNIVNDDLSKPLLSFLNHNGDNHRKVLSSINIFWERQIANPNESNQIFLSSNGKIYSFFKRTEETREGWNFFLHEQLFNSLSKLSSANKSSQMTDKEIWEDLKEFNKVKYEWEVLSAKAPLKHELTMQKEIKIHPMLACSSSLTKIDWLKSSLKGFKISKESQPEMQSVNDLKQENNKKGIHPRSKLISQKQSMDEESKQKNRGVQPPVSSKLTEKSLDEESNQDNSDEIPGTPNRILERWKDRLGKQQREHPQTRSMSAEKEQQHNLEEQTAFKGYAGEITMEEDIEQERKKLKTKRTPKQETHNKWECGCEKTYSTYGSLRTHILTKHEGIAPKGTTLPEKSKMKRS